MGFSDTIRNLTKNFFIGLLLVVIGLAIIIDFEFCSQVILVLLGIIAVGNGIYSLIVTRRVLTDIDPLLQYLMIFKGMLSIVVGLLAFFLSIFNVGIAQMLIVLAIYFIIETVVQIITGSKLHEDEKNKKRAIFEAIVSIIISAVLFLLMFKVIVVIIGILMILTGIGMVVFDIKNKPIVVEKVEVQDETTGEIE